MALIIWTVIGQNQPIAEHLCTSTKTNTSIKQSQVTNYLQKRIYFFAQSFSKCEIVIHFAFYWSFDTAQAKTHVSKSANQWYSIGISLNRYEVLSFTEMWVNALQHNVSMLESSRSSFGWLMHHTLGRYFLVIFTLLALVGQSVVANGHAMVPHTMDMSAMTHEVSSQMHQIGRASCRERV